MGSYVFRWPHPANDVHVTGTFDDWGKSEQLNKVGDIWEKEVDLPSADDKVLYKFVVDDQWIVDDSAPKEGDGHWNINNVLLPEHITRKETKHTTPGAFPETPANEPESFSVQPIPASSGIGNPISLPAGAKMPEQKDITTNTIASTVTTSKEDYENAGNSSFPSEPSKATDSYSVNPLPASSGLGNPVSVPAGEKLPEHKDVTANTVDSTVTTSKEDYENAGSAAFPSKASDEPDTFSVKPIPASSGIGNPVSVPAGSTLPKQEDITTNTVDSTVTTSKEDYDNAGKYSTGAIAGMATGAAAGAAALGTAAASAFKKPEEKENLIPESSLPMGGSKTDTLDAGPFVSSVAPGTSASELAAGVPLEKKRQAMIVDPSDAPSSTAIAASVPDSVQKSITEAHQAPEAATSPEAVEEKTDMEKELLSKVHRSEAVGETASAAQQQTSYYGLATSVPKPVETSMEQAKAAPEAAADTSAVAEKSAMEKELLSKVPSTDEAGEPAPTIAAATSATAPTTTSNTEDAKAPGTAPFAAAAVSDGAATTPGLEAPRSTAPVEKTEAATTEYAPVRTDAIAPGVSSSAAAALSDGTEDPTLSEEPAVKMMNQNLHGDTVHDATTTDVTDSTTTAPTTATTAPVTTTTAPTTAAIAPATTTTAPATTTTTDTIAKTADTTQSANGAASTATPIAGVPTLSSAGTMPAKVEDKKTISPAATGSGPAQTSAPSTPAKKVQQASSVSSPASSTATGEKKKRHRLSAFIKKVFD